MIKCLEQFEECFLENKKFISGNEISYADIAAACEIEQPRKSFELCFIILVMIIFL